MQCPVCKSQRSRVIDTVCGEGLNRRKALAGPDTITRYRQCFACDEKFTTVEILATRLHDLDARAEAQVLTRRLASAHELARQLEVLLRGKTP